MVSPAKLLEAVFFRTASGAEPVREWLRELPAQDRRIIGFDIATAEFGWPVGMPVCRSLGAGLWEIRSNISDGTIARVFFCTSDGRMILLHGFIKKTQRTPTRELAIARNRAKEIQ